MNKYLIALDVDETLNSVDDHLMMCELEDNGLHEDFLPEALKHVLRFMNVTNGGNRSVGDLGMYVNIKQLEAFKAIRDHFDADVLGTSSWFGGGRDSFKVAEFLGIPANKFIPTTGTSGHSRCENVYKCIKHGGYTHVLVLDDQSFGWKEYSLEKHRPKITGRTGFNELRVEEAWKIMEIPYES